MDGRTTKTTTSTGRWYDTQSIPDCCPFPLIFHFDGFVFRVEVVIIRRQDLLRIGRVLCTVGWRAATPISNHRIHDVQETSPNYPA